ncbi:NAD(P)H-hydrate epimerase [Corynebacterium incognita]|uniref:Bifunctional NAD(P)H-hydrate repair enzyme n=1 Tax=Corynebacterium incognita TaxID=2754725 RepID=A0A7G7CS17_9CORY|nr:NAD(P)H-hydrate epimerase [Corynebacterium incognita]QNE90383.1 NAD(P)H-hydrate epimerase [Corynebacterium incognita]
MFPAYSVEDIRRAEAALLRAEESEDQLMQVAASAVADVARVMHAAHSPRLPSNGDVLILAGPGGNGGDGLYAGAALALRGLSVSALLVADDGTAHPRALDTFRAAGGTVLSPDDNPRLAALEHALIIDAIAGLGSARPLGPAAHDVMKAAAFTAQPILAIDMPTGIDADSGERAERYVTADVTVTFGGLKTGQLVAPECGEILIADLSLPGTERGFGSILAGACGTDFEPLGLFGYLPTIQAPFDWSLLTNTLPPAPGKDIFSDAPFCIVSTRETYTSIKGVEPGLRDDKYTGGVTTVMAGSDTYPGAGVLAVAGAVRATAAMVRAVSSQPELVVQRFPEVVLHRSLVDAGRAQALVIGPGRGTDDAARKELELALGQPVPIVVDADALTLLAEYADLRELLAQRGTPAVLTPHAGEFARLYDAVFGEAAGADDTVSLAQRIRRLATQLGVVLVYKGRITCVCSPDGFFVASNAGTSFAATPGSGDVLTGLIGAFVAQLHADDLARAQSYSLYMEELPEFSVTDLDSARSSAVSAAVSKAVDVHAYAAAVAATTPDGMGPTSALRIAEAIPQAIAKINSAHPARR